jgi:hypothetical protein
MQSLPSSSLQGAPPESDVADDIWRENMAISELHCPAWGALKIVGSFVISKMRDLNFAEDRMMI